MKKDYFLIIDTETNQNGTVADFGAIVVDRKGVIHDQIGAVVSDTFGKSPLFFDSSAPADALWSSAGAKRRATKYTEMIDLGIRELQTVEEINNWLEIVSDEYDPILTAYNLAFDTEKCRNTNINLNLFSQRFCLWHASVAKWATTKIYRNFVVKVHAFNAPTRFGNMSFKTNAEIMARFVLGDPDLADEPHTALEDVIDYEMPILLRLVRNMKKADYMNPDLTFNWRSVQVRDHFRSK